MMVKTTTGLVIGIFMVFALFVGCAGTPSELSGKYLAPSKSSYFTFDKNSCKLGMLGQEFSGTYTIENDKLKMEIQIAETEKEEMVAVLQKDGTFDLEGIIYAKES